MSDPYGHQVQPWQQPHYGYGPQPPPAPAAAPRNSGTAVASLVLGIIGILGGFLIVGLPCIAAVICGHLAKREIRRSNGWVVGDGMATAGLWLGYFPVVAFFVLAAIGSLGN